MSASGLFAVIVATTVLFHAGAPRAAAQTPNVVIQWNQTLRALP